MDNPSYFINNIIKTVDESPIDLNDTGLLSGEAGKCLLLAHYADYTNNAIFLDKATYRLEKCLEYIDFDSASSSLCSGTAGIGWLIEYFFQKNWLDVDTNELLSENDNFLYRKLKECVNDENFDFLHGALGIGFYFIKRLEKNPEILNILTDFVKIILRLTVSVGEKISTWPYSYHYHSGNECNLGLSHGLPSLLVFLVNTYEKGILKNETKYAIESLKNFVLNCEIDHSLYKSYFPNKTINNIPELKPSRIAWCYGDLGIAIALWQVASIFNDNNLKLKVIEIVLSSITRSDYENIAIVDAGFCHGTVGAAYIYNKFYQYTGNSKFKIASDYWRDYTYKMAYFSDGLAGFKTFYGDKIGWLKQTSLLEGISGTGMVLISLESPLSSQWSEIFMIK